MIAYKLLRQRRDGSLGPLFINCRQRIPIGKWLTAETHHRRKGYAYRPGWHITFKPHAPHLSTKGRVWCEVEVKGCVEYKRPESQGGMWGLAKKMRVIRMLNNA
jgi:hypothetical protein